MPRIAPCVIHLLVSIALALIVSTSLARAGVYGTPSGGWGISADGPSEPRDRTGPRTAQRGR